MTYRIKLTKLKYFYSSKKKRVFMSKLSPLYRNRRDPGAQGCDCNPTVMGSIPSQGNELLFSILRSGTKAWQKLGGEFRHPTRNGSN